MPLAPEISRCSGVRMGTANPTICKHRDDCKRYAALQSRPVGEWVPVSGHLCATRAYEMRIPLLREVA